jgi:hypothetical protein
MFPTDVDLIGCSENGNWHQMPVSTNQSLANINDNPSLPTMPRCVGERMSKEILKLHHFNCTFRFDSYASVF